jgi:hypothetical protein
MDAMPMALQGDDVSKKDIVNLLQQHATEEVSASAQTVFSYSYPFKVSQGAQGFWESGQCGEKGEEG